MRPIFLRLFWIVPLSLLLAAVLALATGFAVVPDRWNPWAPLHLSDPPNLLTGYKLRRLREDAPRCHAFLDQSPLRYVPVEDRIHATGCHIRNAVRISRSDIAYGSGFVLTCPMAAGLALFERHVLTPAARTRFGQPVTRIEHFGSYACRNVYNRDAGRLSQHATANAFDIAAFRLADGRQIALAADWADGGEEGEFLRDVRDGACRIFGTVLGPDYNAAHHNHFHFDMGGYFICR